MDKHAQVHASPLSYLYSLGINREKKGNKFCYYFSITNFLLTSSNAVCKESMGVLENIISLNSIEDNRNTSLHSSLKD